MKYLKLTIIILVCIFVFGQAQVWKSIGLPPMNVSKIIVDSINQRAVLFGGGFGGNYWSDGVYEMSLIDTLYSGWMRLNVTGPHHKRGYHTFTYDSKLHRAIVFGGDTTNGYPNYNNDVWALNLQLGSESWQILNTTGNKPIPRANPSDIYHPIRNSLIIYSGIDINGDYPDDVWEFKLDSLIWRQVNITGTKPMPRQASASLYDKQNNRMIIFGGAAYGVFYNDVWALDLTKGNEHWTQLSPTGIIPSGRCAPAYGFDTKRSKLYIFGGWNYYGGFTFYNDVYGLDIPTLTWSKIYPTGDLPAVRRNSAGAYDILNDNFITTGGDCYSYDFSDTHILFLGPITTSTEWVPVTNYITPDILINSPSVDLIRIRYIMPTADNIKVDIVDINGKMIRTLYSGKSSLNNGWLVWNRTDNNNKKVSTGVYFCRLQTEELTLSKKFVIVK